MSTTYFTEEHNLFRKSLSDFLQKEVVPHIDKWEKDGAVDTINPEAQNNPSLEYVVGLEIETEMTRSQLENTLEPDYKILKLKEV